MNGCSSPLLMTPLQKTPESRARVTTYSFPNYFVECRFGRACHERLKTADDPIETLRMHTSQVGVSPDSCVHKIRQLEGLAHRGGSVQAHIIGFFHQYFQTLDKLSGPLMPEPEGVVTTTS
mmetsp:Transcript_5491/g.6832  ORF Transcript_5491/g.6832 Transcript_5491/m.6832 type:complete len:121 (+) Transcript_5491:29-391(+)